MQERDAGTKVHILLLDEHGLLRTSLARLLSLERDFEVAGEFALPAEALDALQNRAVDLVLLDLDLGVEPARQFMAAAAAAGYQGRFLAVTSVADADTSALTFRLGASGIFLKSDGPERLVQAIRLVQTGAVWIDQKTIRLLAEQCDRLPRPAEHRPLTSLDEREQKVLHGILSGLTNKTIGNDMGISETSVKNTLQRLFAKTGVRKRSQLVRLAMEGSLGNGYSGQRQQRTNPMPPFAGPRRARSQSLA